MIKKILIDINNPSIKNTEKNLSNYASKGLRTLYFASKQISIEEFDSKIFK